MPASASAPRTCACSTPRPSWTPCCLPPWAADRDSLELPSAEFPGQVEKPGTTDGVVPVEVVVRVIDVAEVPRRHRVGQVVHHQRYPGTVVDPVSHRGVVAPGGGHVGL